MYFQITCLLAWLLAIGFGEAQSSANMRAVRHHVFKRLHRYAEFTAASIPQPQCPNPPRGSHVIANIDQLSTDTQARIFLDHRRKEIIFAAPGTASAQDYTTDGNGSQVPYVSPGVHCTTGCQVHGGFLNAWNSIAPQTIRIIKRAHHKHPSYKVITTGHSLGGAISALAYASLKGHHLPVHGYTFGQPRTGNKAFADHLDQIAGAIGDRHGSLHRVTHAADPVPMIPSGTGGYWTHTKTEFWESGKYQQNPKSTFRCYGQDSPFCNLSMGGQQDGADHMLYSNVNFYNAYQQCGVA